MNILVAKFVLEANANIPMQCDLEHVDLHFGQDCIDRMQFQDVFQAEDITLIPAIYADASSNGVMRKHCFDYIEQRILLTIKEHLDELDAIYLHLHGASEIAGLGSGDHHIVKEIRKLVGPYLPIAVVCDPHGNLCKEYVENATIIRSYRESPHTDIEETIRFVCTTLIDLLHHRQNIHSIYRKLPMILGGEQSVSTDEPVRSINAYMNELEKDPRILSCSWHVGYIRHDCDVAGCGIVVVPATQADQDYAETIADKLAEYVWEKRHEFHYTGLTAQPEEALQMAMDFDGSPVFITDSGDNVTSGSTGANTYVLRQMLAHPNPSSKRILFAAIHDEKAYQLLSSYEVGEVASFSLGAQYDEMSASVPLQVIVKHKGRQSGTKMFGEDGDYGGCITVQIKDTTIDLIVTDTNHPFVERHQTQAAGADWMEYDIVIIKIGYAFPELKEQGKLCVMSLTNGATLQDTSALPFKRIMRPMYPIDRI